MTIINDINAIEDINFLWSKRLLKFSRMMCISQIVNRIVVKYFHDLLVSNVEHSKIDVLLLSLTV